MHLFILDQYWLSTHSVFSLQIMTIWLLLNSIYSQCFLLCFFSVDLSKKNIHHLPSLSLLDSCFRSLILTLFQTGVINYRQSHPVPWVLMSRSPLPFRCATNHLYCLSSQRQKEDNGSFFVLALSALTPYLQQGKSSFLQARWPHGSNQRPAVGRCVCVTGIVSMIIDTAVMGKSLTHVGVTAPCWRERRCWGGRVSGMYLQCFNNIENDNAVTVIVC